jgi:small subunit ribosomal protein S14
MARKGSIQNNEKRASLIRQHRRKRDVLKEKIYDRSLPLEERFALSLKISKLPRNSSKVRYRNRCLLSGRPRGNLRDFRLSRIAARELALDGRLPGVIKASW